MFAAVRWVRDGAHELEPTKRLVAFAIAAWSDTSGEARVGLRTIEESTGLCRHSIIRSIRALEVAGVLAVDRAANGRRSTYRFPVESTPKVVPNRRAQSAPVGNDKAVHLATETGAPVDKSGALWARHVGKQLLEKDEGACEPVPVARPAPDIDPTTGRPFLSPREALARFAPRSMSPTDPIETDALKEA